jgi:hypothetical protein
MELVTVTNPDRGFYYHHDMACGRSLGSVEFPLRLYDLQLKYREGFSVVQTSIYLGKGGWAEPAAVKKCVTDHLDQVEAAGMSVVLRFAYSSAAEAKQIRMEVQRYNICVEDFGREECLAPEDMEVEPELPRILQHIDQLGADVFAHHAVLVFQAGFIGASGEWYDTTPVGSDSQRYGKAFMCHASEAGGRVCEAGWDANVVGTPMSSGAQ